MRSAIAFAAFVGLLLGSTLTALAQGPAPVLKGRIVVPDSSIERVEDVGLRAHTNHQMFVPADLNRHTAQPGAVAFPAFAASPMTGPPYSGYAFETPASIACVYHFVKTAPGCNPNTFLTNAGGGTKAVAIVDAYDYPTAMADLNAFSTQFGLPLVTATNFQVIYAGGTTGCNGTQPANDPGWEGEEALDIEMVHAMAPRAKIFLVEAQSNLFSDLMVAEDCASAKVAAAGGGEVTNSWGGSEFSSETTMDSHFTKAKVVYFASTGDSAGTQWPSASPNVVAVGGTTLRRASSGTSFGNFIREAAWENGGGGLSPFEPRPSYQSVLPAATGRLVPDVSAVANPNTPVWVYDNNAYYGCCWYTFGGTSVASPLWAGIVNRAGHFYASTPAELQTVYTAYSTPATYVAGFFDISQGMCNYYDSDLAVVNYDDCTGVGSPKTYQGK